MKMVSIFLIFRMNVLCLKLRRKHQVWSPEMTENIKHSKA